MTPASSAGVVGSCVCSCVAVRGNTPAAPAEHLSIRLLYIPLRFMQLPSLQQQLAPASEPHRPCWPTYAGGGMRTAPHRSGDCSWYAPVHALTTGPSGPNFAAFCGIAPSFKLGEPALEWNLRAATSFDLIPVRLRMLIHPQPHLQQL